MDPVAVTNFLYLSSVDGTNYAGYYVSTSWDMDRFLAGVAVGLGVGAAGYLVSIVRRLFLGPGE